jgi:hypoxanthine-guanine phosphoribosyltransferase
MGPVSRSIAEDFKAKEPLVIGTLTGAFVFMAGRHHNPNNSYLLSSRNNTPFP